MVYNDIFYNFVTIKSMNNIKLCVFDVDGTLIDTREFIVSAFEYTLTKHGLPVPTRDEIMSKIGKPLAIDYKNITGIEDTTELCLTHRVFQNENQNLVKIFPGVLETLQKLKDKDIKLVVATNRSKITLHASLQHVGLDNSFDLVISVEDVQNNKPAPDCVLKAMEFFSISPADTFMIGDHGVDIQAGKAAGVKTIGVTYGGAGQAIASSQPDFVINEMKEILDLI